MYLYSDKETRYNDVIEEWGYGENIAEKFKSNGPYEVAIDIVIDDETGDVEVISVKIDKERFGLV